MALTIPCSTTRKVALDEYIDHVRTSVDLRDVQSIAASAPMLSALANDRDLVVRQLNKQVEAEFKGLSSGSAQVIFLGQGNDFHIRANVWPSTADVTGGRVYQDQFSYNAAHDHNYNFMTVCYLGPGYVTEIYEYDNEKLEGYAGEPVQLRFLERSHFSSGRVMLYRASKDVHIQYPPEDLSITLNLMIATPEVRLRDQYFFDIEAKTLSGFPPALEGSQRVAIISMAGYTGNEETKQLLTDLSNKHPCRRTRLMAFESLARLMPTDVSAVWERACADSERLVTNAAREKLKALEG